MIRPFAIVRRFPPTAALAAVFLLFAGGCASREKDVAAPVSVPGRFSASGEAPLPDQWWRSFGDSSLNRLQDHALATNLDLRTAWDRLAQARATARREGAALLPMIEGRGSQSRTRQVEVRRDSGGGGASRADSEGEIVGSESRAGGDRRSVSYRSDLSLGLGVSYEVDLWGRIRSARDAARFDTRATEEEVQAAAMTLTASVAITWYRLMEQQGQIRLLQEQRRLNEQVLELVNTRFSQGQVGAADVLQQRQLVESSRGDIALAEAQAGVLQNQLAILLGQPPTAPLPVKSTNLIELPRLPATGVPAALVQRRPDIRQAYYFVLAADRRLSSARAERFPQIGLSADLNTSGPQLRDLFNNWIATLGSNLVAPLLDGGRRGAEVERTKAVLSERLNSYGQTILVSFREVEDALVQERKQRQFLLSLGRQIEFARQALERTRGTYIQGQVDYIRVLNAISTLQSLERSFLTARRELIERRIELCRALGGGWEMHAPPLTRLLTRR